MISLQLRRRIRELATVEGMTPEQIVEWGIEQVEEAIAHERSPQRPNPFERLTKQG